jgi:hypothetical protein
LNQYYLYELEKIDLHNFSTSIVRDDFFIFGSKIVFKNLIGLDLLFIAINSEIYFDISFVLLVGQLNYQIAFGFHTLQGHNE